MTDELKDLTAEELAEALDIARTFADSPVDAIAAHIAALEAENAELLRQIASFKIE